MDIILLLITLLIIALFLWAARKAIIALGNKTEAELVGKKVKPINEATARAAQAKVDLGSFNKAIEDKKFWLITDEKLK